MPLLPLLRLINPTYFVFFTFGPGLLFGGIAALMLVMGAVWFHRLSKLET